MICPHVFFFKLHQEALETLQGYVSLLFRLRCSLNWTCKITLAFKNWFRLSNRCFEKFFKINFFGAILNVMQKTQVHKALFALLRFLRFHYRTLRSKVLPLSCSQCWYRPPRPVQINSNRLPQSNHPQMKIPSGCFYRVFFLLLICSYHAVSLWSSLLWNISVWLEYTWNISITAI